MTKPVLTMKESGVLVMDVFWRPETLDVYEEYYHSLSSSFTTIRSTTYTASPNADGRYILEVTRQNPALDESGHSWPGEACFMVWLADIRMELYNNGEEWMRENKPLSRMCLTMSGDITAAVEE